MVGKYPETIRESWVVKESLQVGYGDKQRKEMRMGQAREGRNSHMVETQSQLGKTPSETEGFRSTEIQMSSETEAAQEGSPAIPTPCRGREVPLHMLNNEMKATNHNSLEGTYCSVLSIKHVQEQLQKIKHGLQGRDEKQHSIKEKGGERGRGGR